ncbi:MAG: hypothetical protein KDC54_13080, partial [Lewinella sp.]|nr:hypothetical protein [Lewinella sp.]
RRHTHVNEAITEEGKKELFHRNPLGGCFRNKYMPQLADCELYCFKKISSRALGFSDLPENQKPVREENGGA